MIGKVALNCSTGNRSWFLTKARKDALRNVGKSHWKDQGNREGGRGAPPPRDDPDASRAGGPCQPPRPPDSPDGKAGVAPLSSVMWAESTALYCGPLPPSPPTARPPVCSRDERQGETGRGEPRRGLAVRVRGGGSAPGGGKGLQPLAPAPPPLSRCGGAQPHACRAKWRGGHGLRLKITPTRSTPCARRSRRGRGLPHPPALRSHCLATILRKDSHVTLRSGCTGVSRVSKAERHDSHFASLPGGLGKGLPAWGRGVQGAGGREALERRHDAR